MVTVVRDTNTRVNNDGGWSVSLFTVAVFVPVMSIAVALTVYFLSVRERADFENLCVHSDSVVEIQSVAITQDIKHVTRELTILANQKEVLEPTGSVYRGAL